MNIILWVLQVLLAAIFLAHGYILLFPTAEMLPLMKPIPTAFRYFLGVAEVLAAVGLTVPGVTRILPSLISWAAVGLMVVMVGATIFHVMRGEVGSAITTAVLFFLLGFVAYMRSKAKPIVPRTAA